MSTQLDAFRSRLSQYAFAIVEGPKHWEFVHPGSQKLVEIWMKDFQDISNEDMRKLFVLSLGNASFSRKVLQGLVTASREAFSIEKKVLSQTMSFEIVEVFSQQEALESLLWELESEPNDAGRISAAWRVSLKCLDDISRLLNHFQGPQDSDRVCAFAKQVRMSVFDISDLNHTLIVGGLNKSVHTIAQQVGIADS